MLNRSRPQPKRNIVQKQAAKKNTMKIAAGMEEADWRIMVSNVSGVCFRACGGHAVRHASQISRAR